jgi:LIVCS family branched-chain amino acid:cation transporter
MIRQILLAGFALFSMFFGSGNLIFPLLIGREAIDQWGISALGLIITGVFIPLIGLIGVMLFKGDFQRFFRFFGQKGAFILPLLIICLLGPFGVIPRCITVAYASSKSILPQLPLSIFSLFWCLLLFFLTPHRSAIIPFIGKYFTPIKIATLGALIGISFCKAPLIIEIAYSKTGVFYKGMVGGYQTMDLLASFFFALSMVQYFQYNTSYALTKNILSATIGCTLLAFFYIGFIYIGAAYQPLIKDLPAEEILPFIAHYCMGEHAAFLLNGTIIIACLTTSMALMAAFTDFITALLKEKVSLSIINIVSVGITGIISTLEFRGIALFLKPILEMLYPFLIILTIFNIGWYLFRKGNIEKKETL